MLTERDRPFPSNSAALETWTDLLMQVMVQTGFYAGTSGEGLSSAEALDNMFEHIQRDLLAPSFQGQMNLTRVWGHTPTSERASKAP